ncbi:MAG TPA: glycosyltransferase family 39 protein, partial [Candidatus Polarisedimenticolaceae bacterium]|nr:glycosyltransferase family 39 protein [Candidatus Polarisedimenticolaceae bacterium]
LFLLALAAGALTLGVAMRASSRFSSDSFHYMLLGDALAHGRGFVSGGSQHPDLTRAPLLPLLMAPLIWLLGSPVRAGLVVVTVAAAALAIPLYFLCRRLFGPRAAYAALPLASVSCVLGAADRVLPTPLHLLGFLTIPAGLLWALARRRPRAFVWVGVAAGLTVLARPEGLPLLALPLAVTLLGWSPLPEHGSAPPPMRARLAAVGWIVAGTLACYGPYVAWTSARLHRFAPLPSVEYVRDTRYVADRFGLREMTPFIPWEERAMFLLTEDGRDRVLERYFETREMPAVRAEETEPERATAGPEHPPLPSEKLHRLLNIAVHNLRKTPWYLRTAHLLPPVPILLGLVGVVALLFRPRGWRPLLFLAALFGIGLLPIVTNLEERFLYPPFAAGLALAAHGWGEVDRRAAARLPSFLRIALHGVLLLGVAAWGLTHRMSETPKLAPEIAQRALAERAARTLPPGPLMAVRPHVPFWAGRRYAPLPIVDPADVLAFARLHGVRALVLQVPYDVRIRPELQSLTAAVPPPGFTRVDREPIGGGGELLLFRLGWSGLQEGRAP